MSPLDYWGTVLLGGPVSAALLISFLVASFSSLVFERSLLKNGRRFGAALLGLIAFGTIFAVVSAVAVVIALGFIQNQGQAELAGLAGVRVLVDSSWFFLLVEICFLATAAYWRKHE